jgi:hypothetical protein
MSISASTTRSAWADLEYRRLKTRQWATDSIAAGQQAASNLIGVTGESDQVTQSLRVANTRIQKEARDRRVKSARESGQIVADRMTNTETAELTQKTRDAQQRAMLRMNRLA